MRKKNLMLILLILLCIGVFIGYRTFDRIRTDTKPPEILMEEVIPQISVSDPRTALLQGVTARDKHDGDVTDSLVVEGISLQDDTGNILVTYAAFDKAGNVVKAQRSAKFSDYVSPRFTLQAPLVYRNNVNFDILSNIGAEDVLDGDIQHRIRATSLSEKDITEEGTHFVQFQVTNSLGDKVTQVFPVEVYPSGAYDATLTLNQYLVYLKAGSGFNPQNYLQSFELRGEKTNLTEGMPNDFALKTTGSVQTQTPGVYNVEFRVTYTKRHATNPDYDEQFTGYSRLIVIVEG